MAILFPVKTRKIGQNLKRFRELAGLSQDEVRAKTGIAQATLSRWETNKSQPSAHRLRVLAKAYGVTDVGLFFRDLPRHDSAVSSPDTTQPHAEGSRAAQVTHPSHSFIDLVTREATAAGVALSQIEKDIRHWKTRLSALLGRAHAESVRQQNPSARSRKAGVDRVRGDGH